MAKHRKNNHRIFKTGLITAGLGAGSLIAAAVASADTTSIANVGNDNLGYSVGTTGGSVAIGGTRTTVDGFGTLHGSTVVTRGDTEVFSIRQSYDKGFDSTTSFNNGQYSQETEIYYPPNVEAEWSYTTPNGSFALVCTPTKGCTTESS